MKHQECVYMPSTVEDWLQEQLVKRGIDAVLFTQYILNLIQSVFLNKSGAFFNNFEQNGLEMLVSELCVNLIDAVNKCEVVTPFLDPYQCLSDYMRDRDMCGSGSKTNVSKHLSVLQDSKMELDLQAILGDDELPAAEMKKGPRADQKCRRDLYLAFTQSLSQEEPTIPLGYNDLRIPRVHTSEQNVNQDTVSRCSDDLIEVSSDDGSPKTEDRNLARLIAKFDSSIEALWNPDESLNGPDFAESSEDLNTSFQQLDPSPVPMDIPNSKQNSFSFLPYGTDICSIWSSQPSPEELKSLECKNDVWGVPEHVIESLVCEVKEESTTGDPVRSDPGTDSLAALNHSKEGSSFTEVKPKKKPLTMETLLDPSPQQESKMEPVEKRRKEKEEEPVDLLVSQSTHFSPIRKEARTSSKRQTEPTRYEDGTTFAIPNALERIDFIRSASGALYLDQEGTSPKKFMEFREGNLVQGDRDFVPKFRVKQNEKWCQTDRDDLDELDCCLKSEEEKAPTWAQIDIKRLEKDLEEQVEEEVRKTIEGRQVGRNGKKDACFKCGSPPSWVTDWLTDTAADAAADSAGEPESEPSTLTGIWQGAFTLMTLEPASERGYPAWSEADGSGLCWECVANAENHKSQLRQELIQEGEQLLNSLSYLLDEKRDHSEKVADYPAPFTESPKLEAEWTTAHGIPGTARCAQRERKRRLSSSQRACSLYMEGNCRRAHCRFSHDLAAVPCRFWGDASCLKGDKCPNLHATLRPVTL